MLYDLQKDKTGGIMLTSRSRYEDLGKKTNAFFNLGKKKLYK